MNIKITTLIENHGNVEQGIKGEHGLSMIIETDGKRILFDTGQTGQFIENARKMNVNLSEIDSIILSHGHYDHTGGLLSLVEATDLNADILIGKGFFEKKYKQLEDGTYAVNGNLFEEVTLKSGKNQVVQVSESIHPITKNIIVLSGFKRYNTFESHNTKFTLKKNGVYKTDEFTEEVALGLKTDKGLILIVGCSHIGIINIIDSVKKELRLPIRGIIGGTHLIEANEDRLEHTMRELKGLNLEFLAVSHCTGDANIERIRKEFKEKFIFNISGNVFEI